MLKPLHPDSYELWKKKKKQGPSLDLFLGHYWIITALHLENLDILNYPLIEILYFKLK